MKQGKKQKSNFNSSEGLDFRLIKPKLAAKYLAICERKLFELTKQTAIPAVRLGRSVRYDIRDLDSFIAKAKGVQNEC